MNVTCQFTLSYDEFLHAHKIHRSPIRLRKPWSWQRMVIWFIVFPAVLALLGLSTIRPIRDRRGFVLEYVFDPGYVIALVPAILAGSVYWFAVLRRSSTSLRKAFFWPFFVPLMAGTLMSLLSAYLERQRPPAIFIQPPMSTLQFYVTLGAWLMTLGALWVSIMWMIRNMPRAIWDASPGLALPLTVNASQEMIRFERPDRVAEFKWRAITNYRESGKVFILYMGENTFEVVVKRAFASSGDLETFSEILKAAVAPAVPASTAFKPSMPVTPAPVYVQPLESREFL